MCLVVSVPIKLDANCNRFSGSSSHAHASLGGATNHRDALNNVGQCNLEEQSELRIIEGAIAIFITLLEQFLDLLAFGGRLVRINTIVIT